MMTYCQSCGRALAAQAEFCPHCREQIAREKDAQAKAGPQKARGFKYWFFNVYWYHYRIHTLVVLFAALAIGITVHSMITAVKPDVFFTLASDKPVGHIQGELLAAYFNDAIGEELVIDSSVIYLGDEYSSEVPSWELLHISLIDDDRALFIIGESILRFFGEQPDGFAYAKDMGMPADGRYPYMVPLRGAPFLEEIGLAEEPMYGLVKRVFAGRDGVADPKDTARYENAVACLRALLGV